MTLPGRAGEYGEDPDEVYRVQRRLEHLLWLRQTEHLRAKPITCPPCEKGEHVGCVRPCSCGGDRHGRVRPS